MSIGKFAPKPPAFVGMNHNMDLRSQFEQLVTKFKQLADDAKEASIHRESGYNFYCGEANAYNDAAKLVQWQLDQCPKTPSEPNDQPS